MSGLRARKKEATSQRIITEACRMFQQTGYEETRIEDVAAAAELSVATFYNYFRSKADLSAVCSGVKARMSLNSQIKANCDATRRTGNITS